MSDLNLRVVPDLEDYDDEPVSVPAPAPPPPRRWWQRRGNIATVAPVPAAPPAPPFIAMPAPPTLDRITPPRDVAEHHNVTNHFHVTTLTDARHTQRQAQNAWGIEREELFEVSKCLVTREQYWRTEVLRLRSAWQRVSEEVAALRVRAEEAENADEAEAALRYYRQARFKAERLREIEMDGRDAEAKQNDISIRIDLASTRVWDRVENVLTHFWQRHGEYLEANSEGGTWLSIADAADRALLGFTDLFGDLGVPSRDRIDEMIATARSRTDRTGMHRDATDE